MIETLAIEAEFAIGEPSTRLRTLVVADNL